MYWVGCAIELRPQADGFGWDFESLLFLGASSLALAARRARSGRDRGTVGARGARGGQARP